MSAFILLIVELGHAWHLVVVTDRSIDHDFNDSVCRTFEATDYQGREGQGAAVIAALKELGQEQAELTVALGSASCLAASFNINGLPRYRSGRLQREAMLYRFEEHVPLRAEQIVADFIEHKYVDSGSEVNNDNSNGVERALGICCQIEQVKPLILILERHGVTVASIVPAAVMAATAVAASVTTQEATNIPDLVVFGHADGWADLISLADGKPTRWRRSCMTIDDLRLELTGLALLQQRKLNLWVSGLATEVQTALLNEPDIALLNCEAASAFPLMCARGCQMAIWGLSGACNLEFRRDALNVIGPLRRIHGEINRASVALSLLLSFIAGFLAWQSRQNYQQECACREMQIQIAAQWLPIEQTAVAKSDPQQTNLLLQEQLYRHSPEQQQILTAMSRGALRLLHDVVNALPAAIPRSTEMRCNLDNLRFSQREFELQGTVDSFADVERITASLRTASEVQLSPPQARRESSSRWLFVIQGRIAKPEGEVRDE